MTDGTKTVDHLRIVADTMNAAPVADVPPDRGPGQAAAVVAGTGPGSRSGTGGSGSPKASGTVLPDNCPVVPLGKLDKTCYYLDASGQLVSLVDRDHRQLCIMGLFGEQNHKLRECWPKYNKDHDLVGWDVNEAAESLLRASAAAGLWRPFERVRGAGAWPSPDGGLILHCGDVVIVDGVSQKPGKVGRHVYPAGEPIAKPAPDAATAEPGEWLLQFISTWRWQRRELDPLLFLGWIAAAKMGGALKWRPLTWITGGSGTGKSTLHDVLKLLFGDGGIVDVAEPTPAGIWQKLGYATVPVAVDESEAEDDNRKVLSVVKLARLAASGGLILRGGQDHTGAEFVAKSCFLFSSILIPPLEGQDVSRMAVLNLMPLGKGSILKLDEERLGMIGRQLTRRIVDQFHRWEKTLKVYWDGLADTGLSARGCDQFATLLAAADLVLSDSVPDHATAKLLAQKLEEQVLGDWREGSDTERGVLDHLMTSTIEVYRGGEKQMLSELVERAHDKLSGSDIDNDANQTLQRWGMRVVHRTDNAPLGTFLAVANTHRGLEKLFEGSKWQGKPGRSGAWVQALKRIEGAEPAPSTLWFGRAIRAVLIPIEQVTRSNIEPAAALIGGHAPDHSPGQADDEDEIPF